VILMELIRRAPPLRSLLAATLCLSMTMTAPLGAQEKAASPNSPKLTVLVLQGQRAVNFIPDRHGTMPVVEVRDHNALPVEGAEVVFTLPASGPSGVFAGGSRVARIRTNADGQAAVAFTLNEEAGAFQIQVTVASGQSAGEAVISQTNSMRSVRQAGTRAKKAWYRSWVFWTVVAGAAGAGTAVALTRGGNSSPSITILPGSPTFSHP
jgi:hypothetical protein